MKMRFIDSSKFSHLSDFNSEQNTITAISLLKLEIILKLLKFWVPICTILKPIFSNFVKQIACCLKSNGLNRYVDMIRL